MTQTLAIGDPRVEARSVTGSIRRGRRGRRHVPRPTGRAVRERRHHTPGPSARPLAVLRAVTVCVSAIVAGCETSTPLAASLLQRPASGSVYRKAVTPAEAKLDSRLLAAVDRLRAGAPPFSVRDALQVDARQRVLGPVNTYLSASKMSTKWMKPMNITSSFSNRENIRR